MSVVGVDLGATKVAVLVGRTTAARARYYEWRTQDFSSIEQLLQAINDTAGHIDRIVIAAAGRLEADGKIQLTNVNWAPFSPGDLRGYGEVLILNDVQCAAGAMLTLGSHESRALNNATTRSSASLAVTLSTGTNSSLRDEDGIVHPAETGHTPWQPWRDQATGGLSWRLLGRLQAANPGKVVITVEDALGGGRGFDALYDLVITEIKPSAALDEEIRDCRTTGVGIGPVITAAAIEGEECAQMCMRLWGPILGQYLRSLALHHLTKGGTIWLYGGIAEGKGVLDFVMQETDFWHHFVGGEAPMSDLMRQIALRRVVTLPDIHPITVRGAFELATILRG